MDAVVAHVAHAAQHDALGKALGALVVAGPELAQHRDQGVADQGVDLVDEQHQGPRVGHAPARQHVPQSVFGAGCRKDVGPDLVQEPVTQQARPGGQRAQHGTNGPPHVLARRLGALDVHVHATEVARVPAVQQVPQREQGGGLAGLARGMEHEVPLVADAPEHVVEVQAVERRDAVVLVRADRAFGVELAHGRSMAGPAAEHGAQWRRGSRSCASTMMAVPPRWRRRLQVRAPFALAGGGRQRVPAGGGVCAVLRARRGGHEVNLRITTAMMRYAMSVAHGALGDVDAAERQAARFDEAVASVPGSRYVFNNRCIDILAIAREMLLGELAYRRGEHETAFSHLRRSVVLDDNLPYDEPWGWMQPTRHALAALLLEQDRVEEATAVYRADLGYDDTLSRACQYPDNVWSLHGYHECLERLGRRAEAAIVGQKLRTALARTDVPVTASCFCRLHAR